jgi:hypothetical protein
MGFAALYLAGRTHPTSNGVRKNRRMGAAGEVERRIVGWVEHSETHQRSASFRCLE